MNIEDKKIWEQDYLVLDPDGPKRKAISLLTGVEVVGDAIVFGPIKIRSVNPKTDSILEMFRKDDPQRSVLELNYIDRRDALSMYVEPLEVITRSFRAIQLLVDNWVGISMTYHFDSDYKLIGTSGSPRFETADTQESRIKAKLNLENRISKEDFIKIYKIQDSPFNRIIERFSRACTEIKSESILDFVIALEGTLGYGLNTEIRHRLSCRGALLLASQTNQRLHYYRILKYLYDIRCSIAHGGEVAFKLSKSVQGSITALGYQLGSWNKIQDWRKPYIIADIARKITRVVLLEFIRDSSKLDVDWLTKLELGIRMED